MFEFTEDQQCIQEMVKEFAEKEIRPIADEIDKTGRFPAETVAALAEMGIMGLNIPEAYGGSALDEICKVLVISEISRCCASTAEIVAVHLLVSDIILRKGTEEQKSKYLPMAVEGKLGAFCLTEPGAGSDAGSLRTKAIPDGDDFILNGSKVFISNFGSNEGNHFVIMRLIESGVVTNTRKSIYYRKSVATFAFGSQRIYDYINNNPSFVLLPVNQCNDPSLIALNPNFISVNSAVEVDFFGQVCAESVGARHISGSGGQVDYVRGAVASKGGKSFIAFSSTAHSGAISRIVPMLTPGAVVTTSKNDVDYIATEYGIAKLRGKTLAQRTKALISIAHPKFREELTQAAKKQNIMI